LVKETRTIVRSCWEGKPEPEVTPSSGSHGALAATFANGIFARLRPALGALALSLWLWAIRDGACDVRPTDPGQPDG